MFDPCSSSLRVAASLQSKARTKSALEGRRSDAARSASVRLHRRTQSRLPGPSIRFRRSAPSWGIAPDPRHACGARIDPGSHRAAAEGQPALGLAPRLSRPRCIPSTCLPCLHTQERPPFPSPQGLLPSVPASRVQTPRRSILNRAAVLASATAWPTPFTPYATIGAFFKIADVM